MNNKRCDLHIHSTFSDSDADLENIFKQARNKGLSCIAITDHDTVEGIKEARIHSRNYNVELIEAVEMTAQYKDKEIHILGYFIDPENEKLKLKLENIREVRTNRFLLMADELNSLGVAVEKNELLAKAKGAVPTRLHLALYLLDKKKVSSLKEAFNKYISDDRPAYIPASECSVKEAIQIIKGAGGLAFLAHPHMIPDQSWVEEFISMKIDGLELAYQSMSKGKKSLYSDMALKWNLLKSGGSDTHGSYKAYAEVGGVTIPYEWVGEMKGRLAR